MKSPIERINSREISRLSARKRFFDKIKKMNEPKPKEKDELRNCKQRKNEGVVLVD